MGDSSSDRPNAVAENAIWREFIRKEGLHQSLNKEFSIPHPEKMQGIAEKPTRVDPRLAVDLAATQAAASQLNSLSQLKDRTLAPTQKHKAPMTTNQEYGWVSKVLLEPNQMFNHTKYQCDVTNYADAYYEMTGRSPYASQVKTGN